MLIFHNLLNKKHLIAKNHMNRLVNAKSFSSKSALIGLKVIQIVNMGILDEDM